MLSAVPNTSLNIAFIVSFYAKAATSPKAAVSSAASFSITSFFIIYSRHIVILELLLIFFSFIVNYKSNLFLFGGFIESNIQFL